MPADPYQRALRDAEAGDPDAIDALAAIARRRNDPLGQALALAARALAGQEVSWEAVCACLDAAPDASLRGSLADELARLLDAHDAPRPTPRAWLLTSAARGDAPHLRFADTLSVTRLDAELDAEALIRALRAPSLRPRGVFLSNVSAHSAPSVYEALLGCRWLAGLERLELTNSLLDAEGALGDAGHTDAWFDRLAATPLTRLRTLSLAGARLLEGTLSALVEALCTPTLRALNLRQNRLTGVALVGRVGLATRCPRLERLDLSYNPLDGGALRGLACASLPCLRELLLCGVGPALGEALEDTSLPLDAWLRLCDQPMYMLRSQRAAFEARARAALPALLERWASDRPLLSVGADVTLRTASGVDLGDALPAKLPVEAPLTLSPRVEAALLEALGGAQRSRRQTAHVLLAATSWDDDARARLLLPLANATTDAEPGDIQALRDHPRLDAVAGLAPLRPRDPALEAARVDALLAALTDPAAQAPRLFGPSVLALKRTIEALAEVEIPDPTRADRRAATLLMAVSLPHAQVRGAAIAALAASWIDDDEALRVCLTCLREGPTWFAHNVWQAARRLSLDAVGERALWRDALACANRPVEYAVTDAVLAALTPDDPLAVAALDLCMRSDDGRLLRQGAEAIQATDRAHPTLRDHLVAPLLCGLTSNHPLGRAQCATLLTEGGLSSDLRARLIAALDADPGALTHAEPIQALLAATAPRARPARLLDLLARAQEGGRVAAVEAIDAADVEDAAVREALIALLFDRDTPARRAARGRLDALLDASPELHTRLPPFDGTDPEALRGRALKRWRWLAVQALGAQVRHAPQAARAHLPSLLAHPVGALRHAAAGLLCRLDDPSPPAPQSGA